MNWYARYPGDYMRDTAHLSLTEHGVYTVLLDHYYSTKEPLPKDYPALIRVCRAYEDYEKEAVKSIADKYFPTGSDGLRHNKRADIELSKADDKSEKARQSAALRWDKNGNADAMRTHKPSLCSPQPQPHPHPETKSQNPKSNTSCAAVPLDVGFDSFWNSYPKKIGKAAALKAWQKAKGKPDAQTIIEAVKAQSASDQWRKDGGQFIPNPATWLNQGRWDDRVEVEVEPMSRLGTGGL